MVNLSDVVINTDKDWAGRNITNIAYIDCRGLVKGAGYGSGDAFMIGDDCYLTDVNVANAICLQGSSDRTQAKLYFGSNKDVDLYHGGPWILKTDNDFEVVGSCTVHGHITCGYATQHVFVASDTVQQDSGTSHQYVYISTVDTPVLASQVAIQTHIQGGVKLKVIFWPAIQDGNHAVYFGYSVNNGAINWLGGYAGTEAMAPYMDTSYTTGELNGGDVVKLWFKCNDSQNMTSAYFQNFQVCYTETSGTEPAVIVPL